MEDSIEVPSIAALDRNLLAARTNLLHKLKESLTMDFAVFLRQAPHVLGDQVLGTH